MRETTCGLWSVVPHAFMEVVQEDIGRGWQIATRLARQFTCHQFHQRRGKRRNASHTQHEGPTALPRECELVGQETGASRAFACASCQTNCTASSLHLPRVSIATTTRRQRADATNSEYVVSLSILAWANTAPSMSAARGLGSPEPPNALRKLRPA